MRINGYIRALLTTIALALVVIAVRPLFVPSPSYAAKKIEYKVVKWAALMGAGGVESGLNALGNDGWDLATVVADGSAIMKR